MTIKLTREEAIKWLQQIKNAYIHGGDESFDESRKEALHMAIEALKADTVEVVRCKDCRHRIHDEERCLYYCEMYYGQGDVSDDNFCQWGAKMDGDMSDGERSEE